MCRNAKRYEEGEGYCRAGVTMVEESTTGGWYRGGSDYDKNIEEKETAKEQE